MRRLIFTRLIAFLLLGATINVATAWAFALRPPNQSWRAESIVGASWPITAPADWPAPTLAWRQARVAEEHEMTIAGGVLAIFDPGGGAIVSRSGQTFAMNRWRYGLPFRSMSYVTIGQPLRIFNRYKWSLGDAMSQLPLRPLFPGFALNTLFYAAFLYSITLAPFHLRRALRRRRNLCPKCAYPIGASAICTECGATLKAPAAEPEP